MGVRFRNGWAVVEKGSKTYHNLRKLPMLKTAREMPLSFLKQLPFITKPADVKMIFGADVYYKYVTADVKAVAVEKVEAGLVADVVHKENDDKCHHRTRDGHLCKFDVEDSKVTHYCRMHILNDIRLKDLDFKIPVAMDKKERKAKHKQAFKKLNELRLLNNREASEAAKEGSDVTVVEEAKTQEAE